MEDPRPRMQEALKEAMKNKDNLRRDVIRMAQNAIKQEQIDSQKELNAEDVASILQKEAKKRRESIDELVAAKRDEMAQQETAELAVLVEFLPKQLSEDEIRRIVQQVIADAGVTSPKDMGRVMGPVMKQVKGLADGNLVNKIVRELLND